VRRHCTPTQTLPPRGEELGGEAYNRRSIYGAQY
jgi:hypothetical protein